MLRDPAILILDEATSAVDIQDEALIRRAIEEFSRGRTTFLITHNLGSLQFADRIVLMNEGRDRGRRHRGRAEPLVEPLPQARRDPVPPRERLTTSAAAGLPTDPWLGRIEATAGSSAGLLGPRQQAVDLGPQVLPVGALELRQGRQGVGVADAGEVGVLASSGWSVGATAAPACGSPESRAADQAASSARSQSRARWRDSARAASSGVGRSSPWPSAASAAAQAAL